ncbi:hypothetical protein Q9R32_17215 [Actinotalea sp. AC32]|nr:hypothetical protein [Actinotalea sp. AC32]
MIGTLVAPGMITSRPVLSGDAHTAPDLTIAASDASIVWHAGYRGDR